MADFLLTLTGGTGSTGLVSGAIGGSGRLHRKFHRNLALSGANTFTGLHYYPRRCTQHPAHNTALGTASAGTFGHRRRRFGKSRATSPSAAKRSP